MTRIISICLLVFTVPFNCPAFAQDTPEEMAVKRGVKYLRSLQQADGSWPHPYPVGMTSLAGATLLECGADKTEQAVQQAAHFVRQNSIVTSHTYSLALALVFLHKLDSTNDIPLIQSLGVRLLAGQNLYGGWGAECPSPSPTEVDRLRKLVVANEKVPDGARMELPAEAKQELFLLQRQAKLLLNASHIGDTPNTAHAAMGLEMARQCGLPVDNALRLIEQRFLQTQNSDAGWAYKPASPEFRSRIEEPFLIPKRNLILMRELKEKLVVGATAPIVYDNIWKFGLASYVSPERTAALNRTDKRYVAHLNFWCKHPAYMSSVPITPQDVYPPGVFHFYNARNVFHMQPNNLGGHSMAMKSLYETTIACTRAVPNGPFFPDVLKRNPLPPPFPPIKVPGVSRETQRSLEESGLNEWWWASCFVKATDLRFWESNDKVADVTTLQTVILKDPRFSFNDKTLPTTNHSTPSTTIDALLALSICRARLVVPKEFVPVPGRLNDLNDPLKVLRDTATENSLLALSNVISFPVGEKKWLIPKFDEHSPICYSLSSMNHMSNAFSLTSIGQKNWRAWGTELLLENQLPDGSWRGVSRQGGADTCHAILFFRDAHWFPEVSARLEGQVGDPALDKQRQSTDKLGEKEGAVLAKSLVQGTGTQQDAILRQVNSMNGDLATFALAFAIAQVPEKVQVKVRQSLAERMARLPSRELQLQLNNGHTEVRRAACNACRMKRTKDNVPYLIDTLDMDSAREVRAAALRALKVISAQDFGPFKDTGMEERNHAIEAWKRWWQKEIAKK